MASGGVVEVCNACGAIRKPATASFQSEIGAIYAAYDVYYQGGGLEQMVFDSRTGRPVRRSELLAERLRGSGVLPAAAPTAAPTAAPLRAMDLGCGNGAFLRALAGAFQGWQLFGLELDDRSLAAMQDIPGFAGLLTGDVKELQGRYDLISMIHALEHFLDPYQTLLALRGNLTPGGHVFIQIPDVSENPFDLLIADHVSHFTPRSLARILGRAGYQVVRLETDWVRKEMSVLARLRDPLEAAAPAESDPPALAEAQLGWLSGTLAAARAAAAHRPFGLFGTSIAATWLSGALAGSIDFYVDEDPSRQGREFMGRPIIAPDAIPPGATVFVGLAPAIASTIAARLARPGLTVLQPPEAAA
ncbi:class I SAM-dependent methyltransferase [Sediminicoccus sp. KRV36]|uniref:class I SAM-dependent methyltransferase n=1 Tax=Sediminicoccus sp. KRV36 TaxID=3133721 RepID=UPI00200DB15E|nr:class I SAM-dependent methyltransferase [Sediminicoccus rosea]UPY37440.1 class I SAM-dependent methyltransferase [Sediminicoccus rosea]UPY38177.1 class I SAM-dependent methyltransferase [Sediminicoccus rosea]